MKMKQGRLFDIEGMFSNRSTEAVTFRGKMSLPIHRWYRLTPSFSPQLADDIADHFHLTHRDMVLDPFSGVGTVPLCMKYRNVPACSIELNPYLHFVSTVKTRDYRDVQAIREVFDEFIEHFTLESERIPADGLLRDYLEENAEFIPPIHKPEKWWSPRNLAHLTCLRRLLMGFETCATHKDLLAMGIAGILIPVSNAKHNHVSLTFAKKPLPAVDVVSILHTKYQEMLDDLQAVSDLPRASVTVYKGNSKVASSILKTSPKISAVITSPPYPNRFSYARETRPHLFFCGLIPDARAVGQLETDAIGGTWGKATSVLARGVEPINDLVRTLLSRFTEHVNGNSDLMANYVVKYFNDMFTHAGEIDQVCRQKCKLAYVIGNSKFYGHPLPSDKILARIFGHWGFKLDRIERMRRRQSKTGLYEAVIFMNRL